MSRTAKSRRAAGNRRGPSATKQRITISLSPERARFLKDHHGRAGVPSVSAFVERLVAEAQASSERKQLNARAAAYYDSLTPGERHEQSAWGELGEMELAATEE